MCVSQVGNLLPHVVVPAVMVQHLIAPWQLSNAQAGMMASAYAAGYMLSVPVLASLTDRRDARGILMGGSSLSALATIGFGLFANDFWSALLWWGLAGIGFGGAYMPGLKALTDRLEPGDMSRSITLYTSSYSLGVGLSFLVSQWVADRYGWRWAFGVAGLGPILMVLTTLRMRAVTPKPAARAGGLLDFRPVIRNRPAFGYILNYGAHCFELYGMRTWLVAFWTYVALRAPGTWLDPIAVSVIVTILAMPASILGNELAIRFGRMRTIVVIQIASAAVALTLGALADGPPWLLFALVIVHAFTVTGDSGAVTAGMSQAADPARRGTTMALHSTVGFGMSALAGWLVGVALDVAGGARSGAGWMAGFAVLAAGVLLGPLALAWARGRRAN